MQRYNDITNPGYCEFLTDADVPAKTVLLRIAICSSAVILSLIMLIFTLKTIPAVSFIILVGIVCLAVIALRYTKTEYEYIIATGEFELSKIYGESKRKSIMTFKMSEITKICPYSGDAIKDTDSKKIFFACKKSDAYAYVIFYGNGEKCIVISAPPKTVLCLKHYKRTAFC